MPYVYILAKKRRGLLHFGVATDLAASCEPGQLLVWYEAHHDAIHAIRREKQIRQAPRADRIRLIQLTNPNWEDLAPSFKRARRPGW